MTTLLVTGGLLVDELMVRPMDLFIQDGRTGFVGWTGNQSLRAIATRVRDEPRTTEVLWLGNGDRLRSKHLIKIDIRLGNVRRGLVDTVGDRLDDAVGDGLAPRHAFEENRLTQILHRSLFRPRPVVV